MNLGETRQVSAIFEAKCTLLSPSGKLSSIELYMLLIYTYCGMRFIIVWFRFNFSSCDIIDRITPFV